MSQNQDSDGLGRSLMTFPDKNPARADLAPDRVHTWTDTFLAERCEDGWQVTQVTTWITRDGEEDGDCCDLAYGLSEGEAREVVEGLRQGLLAAPSLRLPADDSASAPHSRRAAA